MYSLNRRLGRPQNPSGVCGQEKNVAPVGIQPVDRHANGATDEINISVAERRSGKRMQEIEK
jgi:hypothetical protein